MCYTFFMQTRDIRDIRDSGGGHAAIDLISLLRRLDGRFASREQKVADYVSSHLEDIARMTIGELASACRVSTPTVVRFCRTMGCDGYREFKLRLAQNIAVSLQYLDASTSGEGIEGDAAIDQILGALYATANVMRRQLDSSVMGHARDALASASQIIVCGVGGGSSMVASEAASRFFRLGIPSLSVSDSYMLQMRAATLRRGDVLLLISASGDADEIVSAAEIAGGYGATTISITRPDSRLSRETTYSILCELPEDPDIYKPTASRYAHLILVDALAMTVAQVRGDETSENLRRIRASLTAYHGRTGPQPLGD